MGFANFSKDIRTNKHDKYHYAGPMSLKMADLLNPSHLIFLSKY